MCSSGARSWRGQLVLRQPRVRIQVSTPAKQSLVGFDFRFPSLSRLIDASESGLFGELTSTGRLSHPCSFEVESLLPSMLPNPSETRERPHVTPKPETFGRRSNNFGNERCHGAAVLHVVTEPVVLGKNNNSNNCRCILSINDLFNRYKNRRSQPHKVKCIWTE